MRIPINGLLCSRPQLNSCTTRTCPQILLVLKDPWATAALRLEESELLGLQLLVLPISRSVLGFLSPLQQVKMFFILLQQQHLLFLHLKTKVLFITLFFFIQSL